MTCILNPYKDVQQHTLFYQIEVNDSNTANARPNQLNSIAKIFNIIENNKERLNLETYSLSQTSLEQVFIQFARKQLNADDQGPALGHQPQMPFSSPIVSRAVHPVTRPAAGIEMNQFSKGS